MSCKSLALIYNFCIDVGHTVRQAFILYSVYIFLSSLSQRGKKELYGLYMYIFIERYCVLICKSADSLPPSDLACTTIAVFPDSSHTNPISR